MVHRPIAGLTLSLALLSLSGCVAPGMGGLSMNATISGGATVPIDFDAHGSVVHADNSDVHIENATIVPDFKTKKIGYLFKFEEKRHQPPRSVKVEDVSDDQAVTWVDDQHPTLDAKGDWSHVVPEVSPDDPRFQWVHELESSVRVYRFTVVTADGRTLVMYEAGNYPAPIKRFLRVQLGLEKLDKA